jgi:LPXTG-site transpeptidase (sortase) family protein
MRPASLSPIEASCLAAGIALLVFYGWTRADAALGAALDLEAFEQQAPDTTLWSVSRIREYRASAVLPHRELVGVLRIARLDLRAPLYPDTSEVHLNRGVALIPAMSTPGESGNVGIAGHRDGFFRVLKDIRVGESVEVLTHERTYRYRITRLSIVDKLDTAPLQPTPAPAITLVTCYPFYMVGEAPRRFIVRGELIATEPAGLQPHNQPSIARRGA